MWQALLIQAVEALAAGLTAGLASHAAGGDLAVSGTAGGVAALAKLLPNQMVKPSPPPPVIPTPAGRG